MDLAYVAGFFDGEGCIGIYSNGQSRARCLRVQITQNVGADADALLREIQAHWGGGMTVMAKGRDRAAWNYQLSGLAALAFLQDVRPYLRLKASQADVAIEWQTGRLPLQRDANGRMMARTEDEILSGETAAQLLKTMKRTA